MTETIKTTIYEYSLHDVTASHSPFGEYYLNSEDEQDSFIGGVAIGIDKANHHVIFQIHDVDEKLFHHPYVIQWSKRVLENEVTLIKLPTKPGRTVNWKSRNRGGGVRHKNFDKTATKPYKPYTEMPKKEKTINKIVLEPPMGIMSIIKKEQTE